VHAYGTKHIPERRVIIITKRPYGAESIDGIVWARGFLMWDSSCVGLFLEMRSAFIEVRAISEDLTARRRKGEHPEKKYYELAVCRWNDAITALAECLGIRK